MFDLTGTSLALIEVGFIYTETFKLETIVPVK